MLFKNLRDEIETVLKHDPAARSAFEVVLCYPGFHALLYYRLANWLWRHRLLVLGRCISHLGRMMTGIEIHPGARIGHRLFIDHGMGVVIGETTEIGDDVTLYQGVTLGGTSLSRGNKRHPTLEDGVIVGAGAKVLGSFTVGKGARIGANAVVVNEVKAGQVMVGIPARAVGEPKGPAKPAEFLPYGTPADGVPDPVARALAGRVDEVAGLRARLNEIEAAQENSPWPRGEAAGGRR
jgi:serine O-acetyltransferase